MGDLVILAIGSVNREAPYFQNARGEGLTICSFDEKTLEATRLGGSSAVDNPTFLSVDGASGLLYANSEVFGWHEGTVSAFRIGLDGTLDYINKQATLGSITAHNLLSSDGRFLLIANYGMGSGGPDQSVAVLPRRADGGLDPAVYGVRHAGELGPDAARQERPHAHMVSEVPEGGSVLAADLGLDTLVHYHIGADGVLTELAAVSLPPGAGPRHIAQHGNGRFVYVSNELDSTVSFILRNEETLILQQTLPTLRAPAASHGADIHLSPDGRFLYVSNRGDDSIASFAVDQRSGTLTLLDLTPSGGATPRNFALTPSGRHLLVANQNSDTIAIFARDGESGALSDTGKRIAIGTPVCIRPFSP